MSWSNVPSGVRLDVQRPPADPSTQHDFWNGKLLVWEAPDELGEYCIGVDPSQGRGADRAVIQVLRKGDLTRPDMQVAEFASDWHGPMELAEIAAAIGRLYGGRAGEALAIVECNSAGGGDICQMDMRSRWGYTNLYTWKTYDRRTNVWTTRLGWWTSNITRPKLVMRGIHAIHAKDIQINSPFCLNEMSRFESDHTIAKARAKSGQHDDRVMALLIGYWGLHDDEWLAGEDTGRERRLTSSRTPVQDTPDAPRRDFQNTDASAEDMDGYAETVLGAS